MVTSATPEASQAGEWILKKGGNAVDAAVAVSFALAVTETPMSGLGGGTQVLLSMKNQVPIAINGTTLSPAWTPTDVADTLTYHRRSTIPSTVKVLNHIWKKYGSGRITWAETLQPAIDLAEKGFRLGTYRAKVYQKYRKQLEESPFNTHFFFSKDGTFPQENEMIIQSVLAKTLRRLARHGAEDFYQGEIAEEIAADMRQNGGWITLEDLQNFPPPIELQALHVEIDGFDLYSQPPPCGGWVVLLINNLLGELKGEKLSEENIVEALYLAHKDREQAPVEDLIDFEEEVKQKLSKSYALELLQSQLVPQLEEAIYDGGETTHFSVVDSADNVVAVTASINAYFGARAASSNLGFLYNTYMDDFIFEQPEHPFAIRPHAPAYSSMSPTIVQHKGENVLVLGSPGSSRIISSVAQIAAKWLEEGDIVERVREPRIHVSKQKVFFENVINNPTPSMTVFEKYGLKLGFAKADLKAANGLNPYFGGVHAIAKEQKNWVGTADPRRDGVSITTQN